MGDQALSLRAQIFRLQERNADLVIFDYCDARYGFQDPNDESFYVLQERLIGDVIETDDENAITAVRHAADNEI